MPWQELSPVNLRMRFVAEWQTGLWSMTELCAQYQVTRKTGYKWVDRCERDGPKALHDRSRRPHRMPTATPAAIVTAVFAVRRRHPTWGGRKIRAWLQRQEPHTEWPQRTTICDLLQRHELTRERPRHPRVPRQGAPLAPVTGPNDTWTLDFKGQFRTGDATLCYPLTVRDAFSRFVLGCEALRGIDAGPTRERLTRVFARYGLPLYIRTDNGGPFAGPTWAGLSQLAVWWIRLGITPERIDPGRPQQNGSHEQFHAVLKAETTRPPATTLVGQQRRFARFCTIYNTERPHEAIADRTPATVYEPSHRPLPQRLPPLEYPGHFEVRRVFGNGCVSWRKIALFLTGVLAGEDVAFEEVDDGWWTIHFGHVILGRFDERGGRVVDLARA